MYQRRNIERFDGINDQITETINGFIGRYEENGGIAYFDGIHNVEEVTAREWNKLEFLFEAINSIKKL